jgi:predicted phosphoribosyltransferase
VENVFANRADAGRRLAAELEEYKSAAPIVLGLVRGGVEVAAPIARHLAAQLDALIVRKVGVPSQPELAMGAVGEAGVTVMDARVIDLTGLNQKALDAAFDRARVELAERVLRYRPGSIRTSLTGRTVIVVDDGVATGSTLRAGCEVVRAQSPAAVIVAVPVAPPGWEEMLEGLADRCHALVVPHRLGAVGHHYRDFSPTPDQTVVSHLADT